MALYRANIYFRAMYLCIPYYLRLWCIIALQRKKRKKDIFVAKLFFAILLNTFLLRYFIEYFHHILYFTSSA